MWSHRVLQAIETDRRYSKTLSTLELDSEILDRILSLSKEEGNGDEGEFTVPMFLDYWTDYTTLLR